MEKEDMTKDTKKRFLILRKTAYVLFSICIFTLIIVESLIYYYGHKRYQYSSDVIVILGARLYGSVPSPSLQERLDRGHAYLLENEDALVVVTGGMGDGEDIPEAEAMKSYLLNKGIAEERILLENKSSNTFENIIFSKLVLKEHFPDFDFEQTKIGIVTNDYHVFRGVMMAKRFGLNAEGVPAKTPPTTLLKGYLREYFGVLKYIFIDR